MAAGIMPPRGIRQRTSRHQLSPHRAGPIEAPPPHHPVRAGRTAAYPTGACLSRTRLPRRVAGHLHLSPVNPDRGESRLCGGAVGRGKPRRRRHDLSDLLIGHAVGQAIGSRCLGAAPTPGVPARSIRARVLSRGARIPTRHRLQCSAVTVQYLPVLVTDP